MLVLRVEGGEVDRLLSRGVIYKLDRWGVFRGDGVVFLEGVGEVIG